MDMFFGFEGRINRAKWWLGSIILGVIAVILYFVLALILGSGIDMANLAAMTAESVTSLQRKTGLIQLLLLAIIGYPVTALMMKRLNDRGRPRQLAWVFWAPTVLSLIALLLGLSMTVGDIGGGVMMLQNTTIGWIVSILAIAVGIWALIELGILRGTDGPNAHGPDPLGT